MHSTQSKSPIEATASNPTFWLFEEEVSLLRKIALNAHARREVEMQFPTLAKEQPVYGKEHNELLTAKMQIAAAFGTSGSLPMADRKSLQDVLDDIEEAMLHRNQLATDFASSPSCILVEQLQKLEHCALTGQTLLKAFDEKELLNLLSALRQLCSYNAKQSDNLQSLLYSSQRLDSEILRIQLKQAQRKLRDSDRRRGGKKAA